MKRIFIVGLICVLISGLSAKTYALGNLGIKKVFSNKATNDALLEMLADIENRSLIFEQKNLGKVQEESVFPLTIESAKKYKNYISASGYNTAAVKGDGTVVAVGLNGAGQLNVAEWEDIVAVDTGSNGIVGLKRDGTVVCAGYVRTGNDIAVSDMSGIIEVELEEFLIALKDDGTVLGLPEWCHWENIVELDGDGYRYVGLNANGTVEVWAQLYPEEEKSIEALTNIVSVAVCDDYNKVFGLRSVGTVVATGTLADKLYHGDAWCEYWTDIVSIDACYGNIVGLKSDGTVVTTGTYYYDQEDFEDWENIVAISIGEEHCVGLRADGTVVAVGNNEEGQCNVSDWTNIGGLGMSTESTDENVEKQEKTVFPLTIESAKQYQGKIAADSYSAGGLNDDGTVMVFDWDGAQSDRVGDWQDVIQISINGTTTYGLKSDGTVLAAGRNSSGQRNVQDWTDIVQVSAGTEHSVGLKSDGTVVAVGSNSEGQCRVKDWTDIVQIAAGPYHTAGLKSDGTVVAVGSNELGATNVKDWTDIVAIYESGYCTIGLKADGTVAATGMIGAGASMAVDTQLAPLVADWTDIVAISCSGSSILGLRSDGTVLAAGDSSHGEAEVDDWTDIVAVAAGWRYNMALKADGSVLAIGYKVDERLPVDEWDLIDE